MKRKLALLVTGLLTLSATPGAAVVPLREVIRDPFTNASSQHATAVEPDTFAHGGTKTIVVVAQVGRFYDGGASGIGFATSKDAGATWTRGVIPGITVYQGGPWDRVSDPVIAYDAKHRVWLANTIGIEEIQGGGITVPRVLVNRSSNGLTWGGPIDVPPPEGGGSLDKNWITCDSWRASPHFGSCYPGFDIPGGPLYFSRSTDGGLTWSTPVATAQGARGVGVIPVVQPDGDVVVPYASPADGEIQAVRSTDGGVSWSAPVTISRLFVHVPAGRLRTHPLPSAEVDAAGEVYVVWHDCRFRARCASNDIVMSTSTDGVTWSAVQRVPIDRPTSTIDHFIPGLAVHRRTSGGTARLALAYYRYRDAACGGPGNPCELGVGFVQSPNGGRTWTRPLRLAGPFPVTWTALTNQGYMVGDYISTSWLGKKAWPAFSVAERRPLPFDQTIDVPKGGIAAVTPASATRRSSGDERLVARPPAIPFGRALAAR